MSLGFLAIHNSCQPETALAAVGISSGDMKGKMSVDFQKEKHGERRRKEMETGI
jgi:hypothetical protein